MAPTNQEAGAVVHAARNSTGKMRVKDMDKIEET